MSWKYVLGLVLVVVGFLVMVPANIEYWKLSLQLLAKYPLNYFGGALFLLAGSLIIKNAD